MSDSMAAAQADIGADGTEHARESIRPLPSGGEGANGAAARAANATIIAALRQTNRLAVGRGFLFDLRQDFVQEESDVNVPQAIILIAAIETSQGVCFQGLHDARCNENSNGDGHFVFGDQIVENDRSVVLDPVLIDINASGLRSIVLSGDIDPVIMCSTRESLTFGKREFLDCSFWYARLDLRVRMG